MTTEICRQGGRDSDVIVSDNMFNIHSCGGFGGLQMEELASNATKRALEALDKHLSNRTYVVGHSVTLADIILACNLLLPIQKAFTKEFMASYPHIERYFWTIVNQPNFRKVVPEVIQTVGPLPPPPSKGETRHPVSAHPHPHARHAPKEKVKKEKKEAPKPAEVPKPAETPKPVEDVEDEEEAPVKKSKNPLDSLPPSPMVLDNWKRLYSNTKAKDFHLAINGITGYSYNWQFPICQAHQLILNRICV